MRRRRRAPRRRRASTSRWCRCPSLGPLRRAARRATRTRVLPPDVPTLAVEAGTTFGWERWADDAVGIDRFGASAPGDRVLAELGFTPEHVAERARQLLDDLEELRMTDADHRLAAAARRSGQSPWLDNLRRGWLTGGELAALGRPGHPRAHVEPVDLPEGDQLRHRLRRAVRRPHRRRHRRSTTPTGTSSSTTSRAPSPSCARSTTSSDGVDGYVSVEVAPDLARDTAGTEAAARELHERDRRAQPLREDPRHRRGPRRRSER